MGVVAYGDDIFPPVILRLGVVSLVRIVADAVLDVEALHRFRVEVVVRLVVVGGAVVQLHVALRIVLVEALDGVGNSQAAVHLHVGGHAGSANLEAVLVAVVIVVGAIPRVDVALRRFHGLALHAVEP